MIEFGEVKKLHKGGESVKLIPPDSRNEIEVEIDINAYNFYFSIWEKWHYLKMLPNVVGAWVNELPWVLDVIIMFEKLNDELTAHRMNKKD